MDNITKEFIENRIKDLEFGLLNAQKECAQLEQILTAKRQAILRIDGALSECRYFIEQFNKREQK